MESIFKFKKLNKKTQKTMKNTISKTLASLISENLDLSYFFSISIDQDKARLLGLHTPEAEAYLISKGFQKIDYLHDDNDEMLEFQLGNIYATIHRSLN
jgi:hypothetical protein